MTDSIKFTKLDIFTMKSYFNMNLVLLPVIMLFSYMGSSTLTLYITCSWFVALMISNVFAIEEKNNLSRLYGTLSIKLRDIVLGRYIFILLNFVLTVFIITILSIVVLFFKSKSIDIQEIILGISTSFLVFSAIVGVQIPIFFKMGYLKARFWSLIPYIIVLTLVLMTSLIDKISFVIDFIIYNQGIFSILGLIASFIILVVSYKISFLLYKSRR
ncbi:ABC-2 transporter permease [Clostridioides sp. ZZV15-6388]|uniref:ABC-2 transporter permease n=1 Tax=unclassified Clostridioides TaxID=2635829 RepID=UPI001D128939|nr:ABC-2 transporter permease [Clostridioides sp. ZZV15-6388]MCC0664729.1 ABC-2 transporter permease [Clostridioides sp. ZZV15-6597]